MFPVKEFLRKMSQMKEIPQEFRPSDLPDDGLESDAMNEPDFIEMELLENGAFIDAVPSMF